MANIKPKLEHEEIKLSLTAIELIKLLSFNKFTEASIKKTKDGLVNQICTAVNIEYKTDGPYNKSYDLCSGGKIVAELTTHGSAPTKWKDGYEILLTRILDTFKLEKQKENLTSEEMSHIDEMIGKITQIDESVRATITGEVSYKPSIKIVNYDVDGLLKHQSRGPELVKSVLDYWGVKIDSW
jgi:hypothetical protein